MTDKEIIKALECCSSNLQSTCDNCPIHYRQSADCVAYLAKNALVLINRQKAEIEKLQKTQQVQANRIIEERGRKYELASTVSILNKQIKTVKSEAINEFTEKLKEKAQLVELAHNHEYGFLLGDNDIDNLVKEMTEVKNNGKV